MTDTLNDCRDAYGIWACQQGHSPTQGLNSLEKGNLGFWVWQAWQAAWDARHYPRTQKEASDNSLDTFEGSNPRACPPPMFEVRVASEKALFTALCNEKYRLQNIGVQWDIADVMEVITRCLKQQSTDETIFLNINQSGDKAWFEWYPTQTLADQFASQRMLCIKLKTAKGWEAVDATKIENGA